MFEGQQEDAGTSQGDVVHGYKIQDTRYKTLFKLGMVI